MLRTALIALMLAATVVALAPEAAAECQPGPLHQTFCDGPLPNVPPRCWTQNGHLFCEF